MKPQTLPTSIEYGQMLTEKVEQEVINHLQYFIYRREFDTKIMQTPTIADFIPSVYESGVWMVLEKPKPQDFSGKHKHWVQKFREAESQYQTALNKVKFSGFIHRQIQSTQKRIYIENEIESLSFDINSGKLTNFQSYSDLTTLNLPLTERGITHFNINI